MSVCFCKKKDCDGKQEKKRKEEKKGKVFIENNKLLISLLCMWMYDVYLVAIMMRYNIVIVYVFHNNNYDFKHHILVHVLTCVLFQPNNAMPRSIHCIRCRRCLVSKIHVYHRVESIHHDNMHIPNNH